MGKIRRTFDTQFKTRVCQAIRTGDKTAGDACREYQLARSMVGRWLEAFDTGTIEGRANSRERALEHENEKLKAKVGELTMQIDVLKKIRDWKRQQKNVASSIITESNLAQFQRPAERPVSRFPRTTTKGKSPR